jgi:hypothetical protein
MQVYTLPRVIAGGAVLMATGLVLLTRTPSADLPIAATPTELAIPSEEPGADADAAVEAAVPTELTAADAKIRELEAMSETFRNTSFLIAIRDAGFVCHELLRVFGGVDGSAKWMATCSEMLAYTVAVASDGTLRVEPFQQYFDGIGPRVPEGDFEPPRQPAQPLR